MHVLSGTVEIVSWCLAWFWGIDSSMELRDTFTKIQVIASFVHSATAAYQTPIVFGTQAVMVPVYVCCVAVKLWCGVDLWLNPHCAMKSVRLYNILSIYTWCRVMVALFQTLQMFEESLYSIAILLAGAANLPSLGAAAPIGALFVTAFYCVYIHFFCSPAVKAVKFSEHGRDLFDGKAFGQMLAAVNQCPFAALGTIDQKDKLRALFDSLDKDKSGAVSPYELQQLATMHGTTSWINSLETFQSLEGGRDLTFDDFCRVLATRASINDGSAKLEEAIKAGSSFDTQARFLFDKIRHGIADDHRVGENLSTQDLAFVLSQYGMPPAEARNAMRKYDLSTDGTLSFEEFKAGFKPLIKFQITQLKTRVKEMKRSQLRVALAKQHSSHAATQSDDVLTIEDLVDTAMDAVGDNLGEALDSAIGNVGNQIEKVAETVIALPSAVRSSGDEDEEVTPKAEP